MTEASAPEGAPIQAQTILHVTDADTARAVGSGDLPVLGTPRLIALAEQTTVAAATELLVEGQTTVGTRIRFAAAECSLGSILVAATDKGVCAILLGDDPDALACDPPLPEGGALGRGRDVRALGGGGLRFRRGAGPRS
mgnify:CR=1 FL=1